jgi:hypothetical protein
LCDPGTLHAGKIIEVNPAQRLGFQVFMGADGRSAELGVFGLEGPANEGGESFALVLLSAHAFQVFDSVFDSLDVTKHHRSGGVQPKAMSHIHYFEPIVAHRF